MPHALLPKMYISWSKLDDDADVLAHKIKTLGPLKGVVGIARGGLVPTAIIANTLDVRNVKSVAISSYDGEKRGVTELLGSVDSIGDGEGWLFIDDLVDSGNTAVLIKKRYPKSQLAVVYAKPNGKPMADLYAVDVDQDAWLVFPWE